MKGEEIMGISVGLIIIGGGILINGCIKWYCERINLRKSKGITKTLVLGGLTSLVVGCVGLFVWFSIS